MDRPTKEKLWDTWSPKKAKKNVAYSETFLSSNSFKEMIPIKSILIALHKVIEYIKEETKGTLRIIFIVAISKCIIG